MAQMNVSVPSVMKDWCEAQVRHGRYSTTSDYVRDLIRRDQDSHEGVRVLQAVIDEGLANGHSSRSIDGFLTAVKVRAGGLEPQAG